MENVCRRFIWRHNAAFANHLVWLCQQLFHQTADKLVNMPPVSTDLRRAILGHICRHPEETQTHTVCCNILASLQWSLYWCCHLGHFKHLCFVYLLYLLSASQEEVTLQQAESAHQVTHRKPGYNKSIVEQESGLKPMIVLCIYCYHLVGHVQNSVIKFIVTSCLHKLSS